MFPGNTTTFGTKQGFSKMIDQLWQTKWIVYSKKPFSGPETDVPD